MFACVLLAGPIFYPEEQISWQDTQSHSAVPDRAQLARLSRGWQCQCTARAAGFALSQITAWQEGLAAANPAPQLSSQCLSASKPQIKLNTQNITAQTTSKLFNPFPAEDFQQKPSEREHSSDEPANSSLLLMCLFWRGAAIRFRADVFSLRNSMCCFIPSLWFPPG